MLQTSSPFDRGIEKTAARLSESRRVAEQEETEPFARGHQSEPGRTAGIAENRRPVDVIEHHSGDVGIGLGIPNPMPYGCDFLMPMNSANFGLKQPQFRA
jgi:hypothetical protein